MSKHMLRDGKSMLLNTVSDMTVDCENRITDYRDKGE